ncbi:hypothetical protein OAV88_00210 [bacterium]|nr:hypothetical protein [bacterium]
MRHFSRLFSRKRSSTIGGEKQSVSSSSNDADVRLRSASLRDPPTLPASPSPVKRMRKMVISDSRDEAVPSLPRPLGGLAPRKIALFFDFDCTISQRHLYGTIKGWERCVKDLNVAFPDGVEMYQSDKKTFNDAFVNYIFGGAKRVQRLHDFFDSIKNDLPAHLFVTTFGRGEEVSAMLQAADLLRYFTKIQASNGIWSEGTGFATYKELKMSRQSKLDWIEERLLFQNILPNMTWFLDDSSSNYDDGNGLGTLTKGGRIRVFYDKEFKKNGMGLTNEMIDDLDMSIRGVLRSS